MRDRSFDCEGIDDFFKDFDVFVGGELSEAYPPKVESPKPSVKSEGVGRDLLGIGVLSLCVVDAVLSEVYQECKELLGIKQKEFGYY